jgi:hypothetical protein
LQNIAKFHITPHFARRTAERIVSIEEAKSVVKYSDFKQKQYTGEHRGTVFRFSKTVDGTTLTVVAEVKNNECWLITGLYE